MTLDAGFFVMESTRQGGVQAVESWLVVLEAVGKMWWDGLEVVDDGSD